MSAASRTTYRKAVWSGYSPSRSDRNARVIKSNLAALMEWPGCIFNNSGHFKSLPEQGALPPGGVFQKEVSSN
jgi:hypothetical protein